MTKKSQTNSPKSKKTIQSFTVLSIPYLLLMLWEVDIFRQTFISFLIPLSIFIIGGLLLFFLLRKKITYYKKRQETFGTFWLALHGTVVFGGITMFLFMALNFYVPSPDNKTETLNLKVIKSGRFGGKGTKNPYLIVDYHGFEKQLIFPYNTNTENNGFLQVSLTKGLFGFSIVRETHIIPPSQSQMESELKRDQQQAYQKIIDRAEAHYSEGNLTKSIELYERAVRFRPSDSLAKNRLEEIKKSFR